MPRMQPVRPAPCRTSPRTNLVPPPTRSRPHVLPHPEARARPQDDLSAGGSVTSSRRRFASSYSTTSGCGTTSAGQCLTAERASGADTAHTPIKRTRPGQRRPERLPSGRSATGDASRFWEGGDRVSGHTAGPFPMRRGPESRSRWWGSHERQPKSDSLARLNPLRLSPSRPCRRSLSRFACQRRDGCTWAARMRPIWSTSSWYTSRRKVRAPSSSLAFQIGRNISSMRS